MNRFKWLNVMLAPDAGGGAGGTGDKPPKGDPSGSDPPADPTPEKTDREKELEAALSAKDEEVKKLKALQAGEFKRGKELQAQIDELKKAQMSEAERKKAEEEELEKKRKEERDKFLGECVTLAAERAGITEDDKFLLTGQTQDDIFKKGGRLKELIAEARKAGYEEAKKDQTKGPAPGGGTPPTGGNKPKLGKTPLESLNNLSGVKNG